MVSKKIIIIMIVLAVLLLGASLLINLSTADSIDSPENSGGENLGGDINLVINPPTLVDENG